MTSQDPSQFDTEKRLLLALLLSTAVLLATPYALRMFFPPPPTPAVERIESGAESAEEAPGQTPTEAPQSERAVETVPVAAEVEPENWTRAVPRTLEVVNDDLVVQWNNKGAVIESARLTKYSTELGEPLELIPQFVPEPFRKPLSIRVSDERLNEELKQALYEVEAPAGERVRAPAEVVFRYRSRDLSVTRRVEIPETGYVFSVETEVRSAGRSLPLTLSLGPGIGTDGSSEEGGFFPRGMRDFAFPAIAYHFAGSVERFRPDDIEGPQMVEIAPRWVAFDSHYFSYLLLGSGLINRVGMRTESWVRPGPEGEEVEFPMLTAEVGFASGAGAQVFMGPKDLEILGGIDRTLQELVDYGWFGVLVKPLLSILKAVYGVVHNYGWAIIILTFIINLALLPVRYKQMTSMKKMSELQPKLKAIQNRYKKLPRSDPKRQEMNKEVMALYQAHGVNPLGGCLPLLVQMPFLFAFYQMLASSIELRGAPFILWIEDLSKADPYYVTPIVMGMSMVAQQKMTPASGDPAQRRMMMLMPIMFTFLFLSVSSGLAIYFLFSNLFGMLFQVGMQRLSRKEKPSSKPAKKSQGSKRTKQAV